MDRYYRNIRDGMRRAIKSIGHCLVLSDSDWWLKLPILLRAHLEPEERFALAYAATRSLEDEHQDMMFEAITRLRDPSRAGYPMAPFGDEIIDDATFWANLASDEERRAYLVAILKHMSDIDKKTIARKLTGT